MKILYFRFLSLQLPRTLVKKFGENNNLFSGILKLLVILLRGIVITY